MSKIEEIIIKLSESGVHMYLDKGKLKSRSSKQNMNKNLVKIISNNKDQIVEYLALNEGKSLTKSKQKAKFNSISHKSDISPQEYYDASYIQKTAWAHNQLSKANNWNSFLYQVVIPIQNVDVSIVVEALTSLFHKHEIFRTTIHVVEGKLKQKIHSEIPTNYFKGLIDISEAEDPKTEIENLKQKEMNQTTDISKLPLFSVMLIKMDEFYYILLTIDHVCVDLISMKVLKQEFAEIYKNLVFGKVHKCSPLKLNYKDYSIWENQEIYSGNSDRHKKYWDRLLVENLDAFNPLKYFCDFHPDSDLSYLISFQKQVNKISDKIDPMYPDLAYGMVSKILTAELKTARYQFSIDEKLHSSLKSLAAELQIMFSVLIISSINILLHKLTDKEKSVMSVLSDTRVHDSLFEMVGFFAREVLFLSEVKSDMDIGSICKLVEKQLNNSYEHKVYPMTKIMSDLDISLAGLQTIQLNFINVNEKTLEQFSPRHIEGAIAEMGIHLDIREYSNGMSVDCQYSCELFKADTIESVMQYYLFLLNNITQNSKPPIYQYRKHKNYPHAQFLHDEN